MTAPSGADTIFRKSLDRFKIGLNPREKEDFELTTLDDVHDVIDNIQKLHGSERKMQNMARLQGFLEGMEQYGNLIEIFLNVSVFVAFVWGPVKFLLQVAKTCVESLDSLLDAYQQIGETIPLLAQYDKLLADEPAMQRVLGLMYEDILEFHRRALVIFKRKSWQKIFRSAWKDFDKHFKRLLENLRRHRSDIESQTSLIEVERNQISREAQDKRFAEMESAERKQQSILIIKKISPANFNLDQENMARYWSKDINFGDWLFRQDRMKDWLDPGNKDTDTLWVKGIPGAGKSVLASRVISGTKELKHGSVLFFYCKNEDRSRNSLAAILKGFLAQIIFINAEIAPYVYDECSKSSELTLDSLEFLKKLVECALEGPRPIWIVLDGLDECEKKEKKKILTWITTLLKSEDQPGRLRALLVSQDEGDIRRHLMKRPFISLHDSPQHIQAIRMYATRKASKIAKKFDLSRGMASEPSESDIIRLVTERAQGMFLFAKLVLKHLKSQVSLNELRKELEPSLFPTGLYEIYDRIVQRVYSHPLPQRQAAERILAWIVCARRQLMWHEIQAIFSIDLESEKVDFQGRRLRGMDIKDLCGSLVEISSNKAVELVHHTARSYLIDDSRSNMEPRVNVGQTEFDIAKTCLHYLSFPCFDVDLTDEEVSAFLNQGYYSFQDFAIAHWADYLCSCTKLENSSSLEAFNSLSSILQKLMRRYSIVEPQIGADFEHSSMYNGDGLSRVLHQLEALRPTKQGLPNIKLLEEQLQRRRSIFETLITMLSPSDPHRSDLIIYYGDVEGWFKCPKVHCYAFSEGFISADARDHHHNKHLRPYLCLYSVCIYATLGFATSNELKRHNSNTHPVPYDGGTLEFPEPSIFIESRKNKKAKGSTSDSLANGSFDVITNLEEEELEFPAPGISAPLPPQLPPNPMLVQTLHGAAPLRHSACFPAQGARKKTTTAELIGEMRSLQVYDPALQPLAGYRTRIGGENEWVAVSAPELGSVDRGIDLDLVYTFQHDSVVCNVCFSMDGTLLATSGNKIVNIFSVKTGEVLQVMIPSDSSNDNYCRAISFSPSGEFIATGSEDKVVRWYDVRTGLLISCLTGHESDIYDLEVSGDGATIVSGSGDRTVRLWDTNTKEILKILPLADGVTSVAISKTSKVVAAGCLDKNVYLWNITSGQLLRKLSAHSDCVYSLLFTKNDHTLLSGSLDKTVMSWFISDLIGLTTKQSSDYTSQETPWEVFEGHKDFVLSTAISHDEKWIFSGSKDRTILFWDRVTATAHHILLGHRNSVIKVASSPVENLFATASGDMRMRLWRYTEGPPEPASIHLAGKRSNIHNLL